MLAYSENCLTSNNQDLMVITTLPKEFHWFWSLNFLSASTSFSHNKDESDQNEKKRICPTWFLLKSVLSLVWGFCCLRQGPGLHWALPGLPGSGLSGLKPVNMWPVHQRYQRHSSSFDSSLLASDKIIAAERRKLAWRPVWDIDDLILSCSVWWCTRVCWTVHSCHSQ